MQTDPVAHAAKLLPNRIRFKAAVSICSSWVRAAPTPKWPGLCVRAATGKRLVCPVPFDRYETQTLIAAVRLDGVRTPWVFSGAMNGERFLAWVREGLAPTLPPGDWVIMDNLATHKVAGVRKTIEVVGTNLLYLPPYSPDFNPIENMWSKIK